MSKFVLEVKLTDDSRCNDCWAYDGGWNYCQIISNEGNLRPEKCPLIEGDLKTLLTEAYQRGKQK
jgi:hypothetical protein